MPSERDAAAVVADLRSEAALADRPGQMQRLEEIADLLWDLLARERAAALRSAANECRYAPADAVKLSMWLRDRADAEEAGAS